MGGSEVQNSFRISTDVDLISWPEGVWSPKLISNFYWCRCGGMTHEHGRPKLISNFYWCRSRWPFPVHRVQNSFRISTDVDEVRRDWTSLGPKLISNFYWCRWRWDLDTADCPKLISNFYWCRYPVWDECMIRPKLISNFYWCRWDSLLN